ncbi:hypothetical protein AGMMS50296_4470 [Alphaproteobacteria bacterium]|nr:hypothetical protein AGMMS50296_4470 [Alphaproteobacteria bacterium]
MNFFSKNCFQGFLKSFVGLFFLQGFWVGGLTAKESFFVKKWTVKEAPLKGEKDEDPEKRAFFIGYWTVDKAFVEEESKKEDPEEEINENSSDCEKIIKHFEKKYKIPEGLLLAIAQVESICRPWAVNNFFTSCYFYTQDSALKHIQNLEKAPQLSLSVGCMQINWKAHQKEFKDVSEALQPYTNIQFAAKLLRNLFGRYGSWEEAIRWYNPANRKPNDFYLKKVKRHWKQEKGNVNFKKL